MKNNFIITIILIIATNLPAIVKVAVLDLKPINIPKDESILLSEVLRSNIYKTNVYRLMNREDMREIIGL